MENQTETIKNTGRHTDPTIIKCDCGWTDQRAHAYHSYKPDGDGDVEPVDYCPECYLNCRKVEV